MSEWVAGAGGFIAGLAVNPVLNFLQEPSWAREVLKDVSVIRLRQDVEWPLAFEFIGAGGWTNPSGLFPSSDYIGWRNTGVGKGDADAWLTIYMNLDGVPGFHVYGGDLLVSYKGVPLEPKTGAYLHILPSIT